MWVTTEYDFVYQAAYVAVCYPAGTASMSLRWWQHPALRPKVDSLVGKGDWRDIPKAIRR